MPKAVPGVHGRAISGPFALHPRDAGGSWLDGGSRCQGPPGERSDGHRPQRVGKRDPAHAGACVCSQSRLDSGLCRIHTAQALGAASGAVRTL